MPDPMIGAAREILGESLDAMRGAIVGATADELEWRPAGEDTNTIAILVVHAMHSTRWWLSVASNSAMPERDRPSEFRLTATPPDELLSFFDRMSADCRALLDIEDALETDATWRAPDGEVVTRGWALLHALEHLREHVAQTLLTRQIWLHEHKGAQPG
jgi:uncharacterized damage-inducible protein DinB